MTETCDIDVLVVGLGPAGACAAAEAARAGARVLAIERNAEPGLPVQCAEFVPKMLGAEIGAVASARVQDIATMETFVLAEPADITPDFRGHMIDRARFDQSLVAAAQAAGVECRFATPLREITGDGTAVIGAGEEIAARVIVGADGPRSPVGRAIGCVNAEVLETRQITVDLLRPHDGTDIFLRPEIVGGYGWLFPKGGLCNLGLGLVPEQKARLKPLLDALHAQLIAGGRVGSARASHHGRADSGRRHHRAGGQGGRSDRSPCRRCRGADQSDNRGRDCLGGRFRPVGGAGRGCDPCRTVRRGRWLCRRGRRPFWTLAGACLATAARLDGCLC